MYIIADLKNMEFMKNDAGEISYYETEEDALLVCGNMNFKTFGY